MTRMMTCLTLLVIGVLIVCPVWGTTWDLAKDFSDTANPNGPWAYGEVIETGGGPSLTVYTNHTDNFDAGDWGSGQPAWYSSGPWYWSMLKSKGGATALDCPAGRCGGHANTGCRWIAPKDTTVKIIGGAWKMRNNAATYISVWVKGVKVIDHYQVPNQGTTCNSSAPCSFATMVADPLALKNISVTTGDEIYVQVDGNDFTGLDVTIAEAPATWNLAADFSDTANSNGPWAYGEVIETGGGPSLTVYTNHTDNFDAGDWGSGQPAWYSSGPWYWSMLKSKGGATALDCPAGRCGGHANTGCRWTAPKEMLVKLVGGAWKMRTGPGTNISVWIKGVKVIDSYAVPEYSTTCNSSAPCSFNSMAAAPAALNNINVAAGDEIYVQVNGNNFTGLDVSIVQVPATWDLATDFSDIANPSGPWSYGEVPVGAVPSQIVYTNHTDNFDAGDWGSGQPAWYSSGPWYWSMLKSKGGASSLDCPAGRCGGHANTGVVWTAPRDVTASISGGAWKMRNSDAVRLSLWANGTWLIDSYTVPSHGATYNSGSPCTFDTMIADPLQGGDPALLKNISFAAGDKVYVQLNGNDFTGLDLTISEPSNFAGTIKGKVTCNSIAVSDAVVEIAETAQAVTAADGTYSISDVSEGDYNLCVYKNGYARQYVAVTVAAGLEVTKDVSLTAFSGLDCARSAMANSNTTMANAANANDGEPAKTGWLPDAAGDWMTLKWNVAIPVSKIVVDSEGPTQDYKVQSSTDGTTWTDLAHLTTTEVNHTHWVDTINLGTPVTTAHIRLLVVSSTIGGNMWSIECYKPTGTVSGFVKDSSGAPISSAEVWAVEAVNNGTAYQRGGSRLAMHTTSAANGSYSISVPQGDATVWAWISDSIAACSGLTTPINVITGSVASVPDLVITHRAGMAGSTAGFSDNFNDIANGSPDPRWDISTAGDWYGAGGRYDAALYQDLYSYVKSSQLAPCADSVIDLDAYGNGVGIVSRQKDDLNYLLLNWNRDDYFYWHERWNGAWPFATQPRRIAIDKNEGHMRSVVAGNKVQGFMSDAFNTYWTEVGTTNHLMGSGSVGLYSNTGEIGHTYDNYVVHPTAAPLMTPVSPGDANTGGEGWYGAIQGVVTAVFTDSNSFVVEAEDRSSGMICSPLPATTLQEKDVVVVVGTVRAGGLFEAFDVRPTGTTMDLGSLGMNNKSVSGGSSSSGCENTGLLVASWGKVLDTPTMMADGTTRFHVTDGTATDGGPTVPVPAYGTTTLLEDNFDAGKSSGWLNPDPAGNTTASSGQLVAADGTNMAVVANQSVRDVVVDVDFNLNAPMGILMRYLDTGNAVIAIYNPGAHAIYFHERVNGNFGNPWNMVAVGALTGAVAHMNATANGSTVTATVSNSSGSATTSYTLTTLLGPGLVGLYHDGAAQYFDNFKAYIAYRPIDALADAVQVIIPPSVTIPSLPSVDDYVKVTGIADKGLTLDGSIRAIKVRKAEDLGSAN